MKKELTSKQEIKLVGLTARTNNSSEMNPLTAKIGAVASSDRSQNVARQIANRKNPGVTLSVFTDYEGDEHGDYTYFIGEEVNSFFIGEEVNSFDDTPSGLQELKHPQLNIKNSQHLKERCRKLLLVHGKRFGKCHRMILAAKEHIEQISSFTISRRAILLTQVWIFT